MVQLVPSCGVGTLERHADFASRFVDARHVDVWLPPEYSSVGQCGFPVLYMHDGQNLFRAEDAFMGVDWDVAGAVVRLVEGGIIEPVIVVGIWNTAKRRQEYMPQKPFEARGGACELPGYEGLYGGPPLSDAYLGFLVEELKPFIDRTYLTCPEREKTWMMGSSMGGLVSLYALCEAPHMLGGVACLSTHWPVLEWAMVDYVRRHLPPPGQHRLYFDYGTETLDAFYAEHQGRIDEVMRAAGYVEGRDWITRCFEGAEHSERAWRERVHIPLAFLLGDRSKA